MRPSHLGLSALLLVSGCASRATYVHSDTTLGRVVVYRNGVAYFERYATVSGDQLHLAVPADKVDDFLKSLTVVDTVTGAAAPISYPTSTAPDGMGSLDMDIHLPASTSHRLKLSYVTEAPSWKPSYRLTLGKDGKVAMQAWAIVDNTSGEDWNQVKLGVGASSAMSFRFDLRGVRSVARETLRAEDLFALAPPAGESTYDGPSGWARGEGKEGKGYEFSDDALVAPDPHANAPAVAAPMAAQVARPAKRAHARDGADLPAAPSASIEPSEFQTMANALRASDRKVIVEGYASATDGDKAAASLDRANRARERLVRAGVDPGRVVAMAKGEEAGHAGGVRIIGAPKDENGKPDATAAGALATGELPGEPIGTSHFETESAMTVPRGSSAMVSILNENTDGEVVYLYDPETSRGNAVYPFRAVRIKNPTDSALESGPVTVFGDGKFIGEGMCEPIPAHAAAFVPFALDRQIVVEHKEAEKDEIARILTVQRGVLTTEVRHTRKETVTLHNRLPEKAVVYIRHTVAAGYTPSASPVVAERMGSASLFRIELAPNAKVDVDLEEATPVTRTTDLRTPGGLDMVNAFVSEGAATGPLKAAVAELLQVNRDMSNVREHIDTTRQQMVEYRGRMDELHAQIVTLKIVKSGGPLMVSLEKKLQEMSDKLSKATVDVVALEENLMVAKIRFQDKVADLTLEPSEDAAKRAEK
jgi:hypothetical protein